MPPRATTPTPPPTARAFRSAAEFRRWLAKHGESSSELWMAFYTKASGKGGLTYPEAVDEALCFGWIDGVRKKIGDADSYVQRFSPRRARSFWSAVNLRRFEALRAAGRVDARGLEVFEAHNPTANGPSANGPSADGLSIADHPDQIDPGVERSLRADGAAWAYFEVQAPWYRRGASWWVTEAKREETRQRRLATLIADSAAGRRVGVLDPQGRSKQEAG